MSEGCPNSLKTRYRQGPCAHHPLAASAQGAPARGAPDAVCHLDRPADLRRHDAVRLAPVEARVGEVAAPAAPWAGAAREAVRGLGRQATGSRRHSRRAGDGDAGSSVQRARDHARGIGGASCGRRDVARCTRAALALRAAVGVDIAEVRGLHEVTVIVSVFPSPDAVTFTIIVLPSPDTVTFTIAVLPSSLPRTPSPSPSPSSLPGIHHRPRLRMTARR